MVIYLLSIIWLYEVFLHQLLDLTLLFPILPQLFLDEAGELLLFSDLHWSVKVLKTSLHLDMIHVQIENISIFHHVVTHEHSLPELLETRRCMNEWKACFGSDWRSLGCIVALVSDTLELAFPLLRVGVWQMDITMSLLTLLKMFVLVWEGTYIVSDDCTN